MQTPPRANHERSPTHIGIERAMNIENECRTSHLQPKLQAACCQRFYVNLRVQQAKVLLTKAKLFFKLKKQVQPEITNEIFQRLVLRLDMSWSELTYCDGCTELADRGVWINHHCGSIITAQCQVRRRKNFGCKIQTQRCRLNEAAALFKACMSNMSQILKCKSDDDCQSKLCSTNGLGMRDYKPPTQDGKNHFDRGSGS